VLKHFTPEVGATVVKIAVTPYLTVNGVLYYSFQSYPGAIQPFWKKQF